MAQELWEGQLETDCRRDPFSLPRPCISCRGRSSGGFPLASCRISQDQACSVPFSPPPCVGFQEPGQWIGDIIYMIRPIHARQVQYCCFPDFTIFVLPTSSSSPFSLCHLNCHNIKANFLNQQQRV